MGQNNATALKNVSWLALVLNPLFFIKLKSFPSWANHFVSYTKASQTPHHIVLKNLLRGQILC